MLFTLYSRGNRIIFAILILSFDICAKISIMISNFKGWDPENPSAAERRVQPHGMIYEIGWFLYRLSGSSRLGAMKMGGTALQKRPWYKGVPGAFFVSCLILCI